MVVFTEFTAQSADYVGYQNPSHSVVLLGTWRQNCEILTHAYTFIYHIYTNKYMLYFIYIYIYTLIYCNYILIHTFCTDISESAIYVYVKTMFTRVHLLFSYHMFLVFNDIV